MPPKETVRAQTQAIFITCCDRCRELDATPEIFTIPEPNEKLKNFKAHRPKKGRRETRTGKLRRYCADCGARKVGGICRACRGLDTEIAARVDQELDRVIDYVQRGVVR